MPEPTPLWIQFLLASVPSLFAFVTFYFFQRRSDDKRFELERERFKLEQKRWSAEYLLERKVDEIEKVNKAVRIMVNNIGYAYKVVNDLDKQKPSAKGKELAKKEAKAARA
jgi:HAMP domain-containing protein